MNKCWRLACQITLLTTAFLLIGGCGQMGPLYHPDKPTNPSTDRT